VTGLCSNLSEDNLISLSKIIMENFETDFNAKPDETIYKNASLYDLIMLSVT
jgi:hypothetical protein